MPTEPIPGRSLVTRRAVVDIVRTATLGSYGIRHALEREVDRLTIHVDGLRYQPSALPAPPVVELTAVHVGDLAESGTDVA